MKEFTFETLRAQGTLAKAAGATVLDNPLYRAENFPADSDVAFARWQAQARAWESGFRAGVASASLNDRRLTDPRSPKA